MGWLRGNRDVIGLVLAWALLLQAAILGFTSAAHTAALTAQAGEAPIICSRDGLKQTPQPKHQKHGCECCLTSCRTSG
jgi:hypothetical protein